MATFARIPARGLQHTFSTYCFAAAVTHTEISRRSIVGGKIPKSFLNRIANRPAIGIRSHRGVHSRIARAFTHEVKRRGRGSRQMNLPIGSRNPLSAQGASTPESLSMKKRYETVLTICLAVWALPNGGICQKLDSVDITKKISPTVVLIMGVTDEGKALGSGFLLTSDGKIATNLHVIRNLRDGGVQLASGEKFDSFSVLAFDERKDLALIKIAGFDLPTVPLGNSNSVQVGEPVMTVGSPFGLQGSVTTGVVSSMRDDPFGGGFKMIQTDASVNPGNSGGPVVNQKGEVIGIVRYKIGGTENLNFAVPINYLRGILDGPLTAMSLADLRERLSKKTDIFQSAGSFPKRWKSLQSGTTKLIRRDDDRIYVETVLPDAAKQNGCFSVADLRREGEDYSGIHRESCTCIIPISFSFKANANVKRYSLEWQMAITSLSPTRIEGWIMAPPPQAKFSCTKGTYSQPPIRQPFTWIPEQDER